jgi:hypothetical protein
MRLPVSGVSGGGRSGLTRPRGLGSGGGTGPLAQAGSAAVFLLVLFQRGTGKVAGGSGLIPKRTDPVILLFGCLAASRKDCIDCARVAFHSLAVDHAQALLLFAKRVEADSGISRQSLLVSAAWRVCFNRRASGKRF